MALPVEPYAFGYWLGTGSGDGVIYVRGDAFKVWDRMGMAGLLVGRRIVDVPGLAKWTRDSKLGLTGTKFIPKVYMQASVDEKQDLLDGIWDSMADADGNITTVKQKLAEDIMEVLLSLGMAARLYEKNLLFEGRKVGEAWELAMRSGNWGEELL